MAIQNAINIADATLAATIFESLAPPKAGNSLKVLRVNAGETAYELVTLAGGGDLLSTNNLSDLANAGTARTNLGATTVGGNLFTLTNPGAIRFVRLNADNTVSSRTAAEMLSDIGAQASGSYQPLDSDLTTIAGLTATTDNFIVSVSSAWASRTPSQVKTTLSLDNVTNESKTTMFSSPAFTGTVTLPTGLTGVIRADSGVVSVDSDVTNLVDNLAVSQLADGTDGELITWNSSGAPTTVAVGTAGHVLTSNGTGNAPTFQAATGGIPTQITVADTTDATCFVALFESATGDLGPKTDAGATYDASTGVMSLTSLSLAAGTATLAPLVVASGTLKTTPAAGDIERDANCFYGTTDAGNRGYIPVRHVIRCNATRTLPNDANLNPIFNSPANGRLTLETGTYLFKGLIIITSMSGTSGNALFNILGAGTATIGAWLWYTAGLDNTTPATISADLAAYYTTNATAASVVTAATGTALRLNFEGTFEVTGAGTLIPSIDLVNAAAGVVSIGSYFMCERIGSDSLVSIGQWD